MDSREILSDSAVGRVDKTRMGRNETIAAPLQRNNNENPASPVLISTSLLPMRRALPNGTSETFQPDWRLPLALGTLSIIGLAASLDGTSISPALPIIATKLHGSAIQAFWAGTSFRLAATVFQPSYACFAAVFGRKPMVMLALVFFTTGTIVAAVSDNFIVLLAGRTVQGIGAGGFTTMTEIIVTDLVPLRHRGKWFGIISMAVAVGSGVGPVIGGSLAQKVSWRWLFWINVPLCGIALLLIPITLEVPYKPPPIVQELKEVDWVGTILFIISVTGFLIPISWGGVLYQWRSWRVLVPLCISTGGIIVFVFYEKFVAIKPFIRPSIFHNRTASITYLTAFLHGVVVLSLLYYLPLYYEAVKELSPTKAGLALFPETFSVAPACIIMGLLVSYTGRYQRGVWAGWLLTTVGAGLLCLLDINTGTVKWIFLNIVAGIGIGILYSAMSFAIQASASASEEDSGFAIAMFSFFRSLGTAIGVAISGMIFQNVLKNKLLSYPALAPFAEEYSQNAAELIESIKAMRDGTVKIIIQEAYSSALQIVWAVMCAVTAVGLVASLFTVEYTLDEPEKAKDLDNKKYAGKGTEKPFENIGDEEDIVRMNNELERE